MQMETECIIRVNKPGGQENRRLISHFSFKPRLPSAWASNSETVGKGAEEVSFAFLRLLTARVV